MDLETLLFRASKSQASLQQFLMTADSMSTCLMDDQNETTHSWSEESDNKYVGLRINAATSALIQTDTVSVKLC